MHDVMETYEVMIADYPLIYNLFFEDGIGESTKVLRVNK